MTRFTHKGVEVWVEPDGYHVKHTIESPAWKSMMTLPDHVLAMDSFWEGYKKRIDKETLEAIEAYGRAGTN